MPCLDNRYPVDQRYAAFEDHENGLLVSRAGPGTGKTYSFLRRIRSLTLNRHIPPDEICYLTFIKEISNAFLSDYLEEFTEQVENQPRPRISTLHSFACRIIRNRGFTLGYDGSLFFTSFVSDDDPSSDIFIDDLLSFLRRFRDRSKPRIKGLICEAKAAWRNNIDPLRLHAPIPSLLSTTINLARTYRLIDWDQAIPFATNLYQNPDNRDRWLLRLHHFLIDEYQDFNAAEQALISLLIPDISSIVIVGDDNQSIYSGRGASPIGISQLITRPEVDSINLLRCRRQKSVLLHATNSFLHYMHPDAQPLLPHEEGGRINSFSFRSSKAEIEFLIQFLNTAIESLPSNPRPKDGIVCLFPLRKALRFYYERLSTHVPSTIRNPIPHNDRIFLSRLLELLIYRNQRFIERLIVDRFQYITRQYKNRIIDICMRDNISIPESIASIINNNNILSDRATESARVYCRLCNALSQRDIGELSVIIPSLLHIEVGLLRIELENIINNVETPDHEDLIERTCDRLLPEYAVPPEQMSSVLFLTIHGSKGLTKHTVVLPGLEDSWLPGQSIDEELHEKQRIYFVALTRATDQILITFPYNRARGDPLNYPAPGRSEPSRFVRYCNIQTRYHE